MVVRIFLVYILPSLEYAIPIWMGSDPIKSAVERLNAVFNRYLKRYLWVPYTSCNHFTHFNCQTSPIFELLIQHAQERALDLYVPFCLSGAQLTFVNTIPKVKPYIPLYELVPQPSGEQEQFTKFLSILFTEGKFSLKCLTLSTIKIVITKSFTDILIIKIVFVPYVVSLTIHFMHCATVKMTKMWQPDLHDDRFTNK